MRPLQDFRRDVRYALAGWLRHPLFAITAIATIGLGLGAAISVFTLVNSLFLRALPVPGADRLVRVYFERRGNPALGLAAIRLLRQRAPAFDAVIAHDSRNVVMVRIGNRSVEQNGAFVSANYWSTLGITPRLGRFFVPEEDSVVDRDAVAVVSSAFWHAQLADDPNVIGRRIKVTNRDFTIIGVAPEGFQGISVGQVPNDLWMPLMMARVGRNDCITEPHCRLGDALARLAPGATAAMARAQVQTLARGLSSLAFADDSARHVIAARAEGLSVNERAEYVALMRLLAAIAGVLLLIACANLSGLLLARGVARHREMAVRKALGAGRGRLTRQLLTESLVIAVAGAGLGLLLSTWVSQALLDFFSIDDEGFHHFFHFAPDIVVVGFTLIAATTAVLLFGMLPALSSARTDPATMLKAGASGVARTRMRSALVGAQVALSVVLLTAAILLARSFANLMTTRVFDAEHVAMMRWRPDLNSYPVSRFSSELSEIVTRVRSAPDVQSVAFRRCCGLLWSASPNDGTPVGFSSSDTVTLAQAQFVSPEFFATLRVPLLAGREFTEQERDNAPPVVIVNRTLASQLWGATTSPASLVGRELRVSNTRARVVGVVADFYPSTLLMPSPAVAFEPYWQTTANTDGDTRFAIRVRGDAARAIPALRRAFSDVDPLVLTTEVMPMKEQIGARFVQIRVGEAVLLASAAIALFLSGMGLYGVIAFLVAHRTREVGIRIALGASMTSVTRLFLADGMRAAFAGVVAGLAITYAGRRLLSAWLVGVAPNDKLSFAISLAAVVAVSLAASYFPARRASRMDPTEALRME